MFHGNSTCSHSTFMPLSHYVPIFTHSVLHFKRSRFLSLSFNATHSTFTCIGTVFFFLLFNAKNLKHVTVKTQTIPVNGSTIRFSFNSEKQFSFPTMAFAFNFKAAENLNNPSNFNLGFIKKI